MNNPFKGDKLTGARANVLTGNELCKSKIYSLLSVSPLAPYYLKSQERARIL
jgi:hypothetical protein